MTDPQDEHRAIAIQCVAELARGVQILEAEVIGGAGRRDVRDSIDSMRTVLKVLQDATARDGRWGHWKSVRP
jgi:hypothetical protein